jgi:hypothetical protein
MILVGIGRRSREVTKASAYCTISFQFDANVRALPELCCAVLAQMCAVPAQMWPVSVSALSPGADAPNGHAPPKVQRS